ncbi:hypothetical protein ACFXGG_33490 [Streptomyces nigra]|uniref:hypothetical protein n=1 Tax=Streptomyces nigra TaxID=1827580 RepID=UPI0036BAB981
MRRRLPQPDATGYPPPLDVFDPRDWWVSDLEEDLEVQYARIRWGVARRAYREGWPDWRSFLPSPPPWAESPRVVQRDSAYTSSIPEAAPEGASPQARAMDWKGL